MPDRLHCPSLFEFVMLDTEKCAANTDCDMCLWHMLKFAEVCIVKNDRCAVHCLVCGIIARR